MRQQGEYASLINRYYKQQEEEREDDRTDGGCLLGDPVGVDLLFTFSM
jgi:hypothetical protein